MFGARGNTIKGGRETELEKEMSQKEREERNKSGIKREQEMEK